MYKNICIFIEKIQKFLNYILYFVLIHFFVAKLQVKYLQYLQAVYICLKIINVSFLYLGDSWDTYVCMYVYTYVCMYGGWDITGPECWA